MDGLELDLFLATMRKRFQMAVEAEAHNREEARQDLEFIIGNQWDEQEKERRRLARRPALTFNRLPAFVQQVVNDARQNEIGIRVSPVDSETDPDTAQVLQGLIRHIEYDSDADVAYDTALEYAAACGFGYWRIKTDYCEDGSFDNQDLKIEAIPDPFSVYMDPAAKKHDRSDAMWAFIVDWMTHEQFKAEYPQAQVASVGFDETHPADWITRDGVQVAEYWVVDERKRTLCLLADGSTAYEDEIPEDAPVDLVLKRREVRERKVTQYITNGVEILEEHAWPGQWIPIVPVFGREMWVRGRRYLFSLVRFARDPQKLYNFYKTAIAETVSLSSRAPWIGYKGQFTDPKWKTANAVNHAYLEAEPLTIAGQPAPLPVRNNFEPPVQALSLGALQAADDMKAIMSIYDASLGAASNETSGVAILRRQRKSDVANLHFVDNQSRAKRHTGRILLDLIPKIYDTARQVRIIGEDQAERIVTVNAQYLENGKQRNYDLSAGKYDVRVSVGPSYLTQRLEAFDTLTALVQAYPPLMEIAGHIIFRNSDIPGAEEVARLLKRRLPPELQEDERAEVPAQARAQMAQMAQTIEQLTKALNEATEAVAQKRLELESKERIEALKIQADLVKTEAQLGSREAIEMLRAEIASIGQKLAQGGAGEAPAVPPAA